MMAAPTKLWMRLTRGLGRDGNELRRRSDHVEALLRPAAFALFLLFIPVIAVLSTGWVRAGNASAVRAEHGEQRVPGVLLESVPGPMQADHGANTWLVQTRARWTWHGQPRVGDVPAEAGSAAGSRVIVYVNAAGRVQTPPMTTAQVTGHVVEISLGVMAVLALMLAALSGLVRRVLDKRRIAAWERAWQEFGPIWSRRGPSTSTGREA
jgi:hypothetical protein